MTLAITWFDPYLPLLALSRGPATTRTSLEEDLVLIARAGVSRVVCLQEAFELDMIDESIESRARAIESRDIAFTHEPVEDYGPPSIEQMHRILDLVAAHETRGEKVLVHCQAGLGRAGTIAACLMLRHIPDPEGAMAMTRYMRPGAIQSASQEAFIARFALTL